MHDVLVIFIALVVWGAVVFFSPTAACRCAGRCGRCKGTGRRFRPGARLVHRAVARARRQRSRK